MLFLCVSISVRSSVTAHVLSVDFDWFQQYVLTKFTQSHSELNGINYTLLKPNYTLWSLFVKEVMPQKVNVLIVAYMAKVK